MAEARAELATTRSNSTENGPGVTACNTSGRTLRELFAPAPVDSFSKEGGVGYLAIGHLIDSKESHDV